MYIFRVWRITTLTQITNGGGGRTAATQCIKARRHGEDKLLKFKPSIGLRGLNNLQGFSTYNILQGLQRMGENIHSPYQMSPTNRKLAHCHGGKDEKNTEMTLEMIGSDVAWGIFSWHTLGLLLSTEHQ